MAFDPKVFMNQSVTGPLSTSVKPCPEGEFPFTTDTTPISDKNFRSGKRDDGTVYHIFTLTCVCQSDEVKRQLNREKVLVPYDMFLDITDTGELDVSEGMNTKLGRLREVLGQNADTDWNFGKLLGQGPFIGVVKHQPNKNDKDNPFAKIDKVTKIA